MNEVASSQWVPTICFMCYASCGIKARRVNGLLTELKGHEANPNSLGKICAKGAAGIMGIYDPYRVTVPLRRTNPQKGIGVDPGWEEISWQKALNIIVNRLKEVRRGDPREMVTLGLDFNASLFQTVFGSCYGSAELGIHAAEYFCGNVLHLVHYLQEGAFFAEVDFQHCNYLILVGNQEGFLVNKNPLRTAQRMADARARGMKLVVVDPVLSASAAKADEWVPIRPGTDAALALAMANILVNELGIYDSAFLSNYTNAPYLVGEDGRYVRDAVTGKPLVWDSSAGVARGHDEPDMAPALEGNCQVGGEFCQPAFQRLKSHLKEYSHERAAEITTVPASTIKRLAAEFGQAARIGSTICFEDQKLPLRPVAVQWTKGAECHKHGAMAGLALQMLNILMGAVDVPGGILGNRTVDRMGTKAYYPTSGPDGLLVPQGLRIVPPPFPAQRARPPESTEMKELFPVATGSCPMFEEAMLAPEKYQMPFQPKFLLHVGSNIMMSTSNPEKMAQVLNRVQFMVSFATHINETVELADLVLPAAHYLEYFLPFPNRTIGYVVGPGHWYRSMANPASDPAGQARPMMEVLLELAERLGIIEDYYIILNTILGLKEPYRLDVHKRYRLEEIGDVWAKSWFGPQYGVEWFRVNGVLVYDRRKVEEVYPRVFLSGRIPIYLEHLLDAGDDLKEVTDRMGLEWDVSDYQPLPDWHPCPAYENQLPGFDLYAVNYKLPFHAFSVTAQNPWLDELAQRHPYAYKILINKTTARSKGFKDGDLVWLESSAGKVKGRLQATEGIHPEVLAMAGTFGHWAREMPVAKGKGSHFNTLLSSTPQYMDLVAGHLDACVKVKIIKSSDSPTTFGCS